MGTCCFTQLVVVVVVAAVGRRGGETSIRRPHTDLNPSDSLDLEIGQNTVVVPIYLVSSCH